MAEQWTLIAPVPQWNLPADWPGCDLKPDIRVVFMSPQLRRALLNAAKESKCRDEVLSVVNNADTAVLAGVAETPSGSKSGYWEGLSYQFVSDAIVRRLFESVAIFTIGIGDVPEGYWHSCWFQAKGGPASTEFEGVRCLGSDWTPDTIPPTVDPDSVDVSEALTKVCENWQRLSALFHIEDFLQLYVNPAKQKAFFDAGNANIKLMAAQLAAARAGETPSEEAKWTMRISKRQSSIWFAEGFRNAYREAVDKLEAKEYGRGARLARAVLFFEDAIRMQYFVDVLHTQKPSYYLSLSICLESLFSLGNEELTFQLAARIGWLLHPNEAKSRMGDFKLMKDIYNLRSKIVHGGAYKTEEFDCLWAILLGITRMVLVRIISEERLFKAFTATDSKQCDDLLKRLALGCDPLPEK